MEKIDSKIITSEAGIAGLLFGAVSGGYMFLPESKLGWLLSIAKLVGLIWLMRWWMLRLCQSYEGVTWQHTRRFGTLTAFFSSLITGLCFYFSATVVNPDMLSNAMNEMLSSGVLSLSPEQMDILDGFEDSFPLYGLISNIIYCFIYGWVLSSILSSRIPGRNPFAGRRRDEDLDDII